MKALYLEANWSIYVREDDEVEGRAAMIQIERLPEWASSEPVLCFSPDQLRELIDFLEPLASPREEK